MSDGRYTLHHSGYGKDCQPEIVSAEGAYLHTRDGRRLLDMGLGAGSQILGHAHPSVVEAVQQQIRTGSIYLNNNPQIHGLCERLVDVLPPSQRHFVFCNSGSEATQRALRLARAATGRERIACFQGGWHGMNEWTLLDDGGRFGAGHMRLPDGIPALVCDHTLLLPYNDERAFALIDEQGASLAAVIIEPVQGSNPRDDVRLFLKTLEERCHQHGILVIYDEIITGFRLDLDGASGYWELCPDIVTYGKVLGGGLPIGLVTCTDAVAEKTFGSSSKRILTGGTFSANPLVAATASAVLDTLRQCQFADINALGSLMRDRLRDAFNREALPLSTIGIGSISRVTFTNQPFRNREERDALELPPAVQQRFRQLLLEQGIVWPTNGIVFTGFCHDAATIERMCDAVLSVAKACCAETVNT